MNPAAIITLVGSDDAAGYVAEPAHRRAHFVPRRQGLTLDQALRAAWRELAELGVAGPGQVFRIFHPENSPKDAFVRAADIEAGAWPHFEAIAWRIVPQPLHP